METRRLEKQPRLKRSEPWTHALSVGVGCVVLICAGVQLSEMAGELERLKEELEAADRRAAAATEACEKASAARAAAEDRLAKAEAEGRGSQEASEMEAVKLREALSEAEESRAAAAHQVSIAQHCFHPGLPV